MGWDEGGLEWDGMKAGLDGSCAANHFPSKPRRASEGIYAAGFGDLPYFTSTGMLAEWAENSGA
jgi:hypothetical protein